MMAGFNFEKNLDHQTQAVDSTISVFKDLNNHQKPTFHPLGDFLNPALALLGQGLKKSPIG
jgi:type III restriction enzyme